MSRDVIMANEAKERKQHATHVCGDALDAMATESSAELPII